jgi:hypothetical protein
MLAAKAALRAPALTCAVSLLGPVTMTSRSDSPGVLAGGGSNSRWYKRPAQCTGHTAQR